MAKKLKKLVVVSIVWTWLAIILQAIALHMAISYNEEYCESEWRARGRVQY
jgi:hypothetical protein